jgi:hypothetical protein
MKKKYKKIYIDNDEAKSLGLPNRTIGKTIREDGFIFKQYYYNIDNMGFKSKPLELWNSPDAVKRNKIMKAIDKKAVSFRNKKLLKRIKNMFGCSVCCYNKCSDALHFHHIIKEDKQREVSRMLQYSTKTLKEEIRKCVIYCANCHAEHHYNERKDIA